MARSASYAATAPCWRVSPDKIEYLVNGTLVTSTPKTGDAAKTDGLYGIRVNHNLDVHVSGFGMSAK